jgi:hypothetical protein
MLCLYCPQLVLSRLKAVPVHPKSSGPMLERLIGVAHSRVRITLCARVQQSRSRFNALRGMQVDVADSSPYVRLIQGQQHLSSDAPDWTSEY